MNQERHLDDAAIVEACKARDPKGGELLVERAYDRVYRVALPRFEAAYGAFALYVTVNPRFASEWE